MKIFTTSLKRVKQPQNKSKHGALGSFTRAASLLVLVGVLLFSTGAPALAQAASEVNPQLQLEAGEIQKLIDKVPDSSFDKKAAKNSFRSDFDSALNLSWWGWLKDRDICHTIEKLTLLLDALELYRERHPGPELEELYSRIWTLRAELMALAGTKCQFEQPVGQDPNVSIGASDNTHLQFTVGLSMPTLTTAIGNSQTFSRVHVPGLENMVGQVGEPAVPVWRELVAIPEGSIPVLRTARANEGRTIKLNLVPFQEQAVDPVTSPSQSPPPPAKTFADKPFVLNERTYAKDEWLPPNPCKLSTVGQYRDLQIAQLECATAQYNPVSDDYHYFKSFDIEVAFEGGNGKFITSRSLHPFESNHDLVKDVVINKAVVDRYVRDFDFSALPCFGEEFLILTHHNFRASADRLAEHKRSRGISTTVFEVGSTVPSRDTAEEIDDFIEDRYDDCQVRPSYVMLLGDAEFIPTFYPSGLADNAGTDFPYSNYVQILFDAFFPDFGTGRVPVDNLAQANHVVDKIITYEASPPHQGFGDGGPFYTTVGLASQFQCCRMNANGTPLNNQAGTDQRAFIETTELVRNELLDRGYTAPRIYTRTTDNGGYCIQQNSNGQCTMVQSAYSGDATPRRYFNGTLLPGAIGGGSGFAWSGSTANIRDAWNEGRFLFLHRDHGWPGGWANPGFSTNDVNALTNKDLLPVVFSVNCASGLFDNETAGGIYSTTASDVYFAEAALRKQDGGAIGIIGDTRNSPTWANNALTRGFFDAVWPDTLPGEGSSTPHKRLGDILNFGKVYLMSQLNVPQTAGDVPLGDIGFEYNIWNLIGDPTLAMWTKNPRKLVLTTFYRVEHANLRDLVHYEVDGATITKLQLRPDGSVLSLGRAVVRDGVADMSLLMDANPQLPVMYMASKADSIGTVLSTDRPLVSSDPQLQTR